MKSQIVLFISFLIFYSVSSKGTENENLDGEETTLDKDKIDIDYEVYKNLPGKSINGVVDLDNYKKVNDMSIFTYYYRPESKNSYAILGFVYRIHEKLEYLVDMAFVDCSSIENESLSECFSKNLDEYPQMYILIPPQYKFNPYTKKEEVFRSVKYSQSSVTEQELYKFVSNNINSKGIKLTSETSKDFLKHPSFNKVILFTDKAQSGLIFKGLSNYFYDRILFCEVHKDESYLLSKFNVKKFPSLIVVETLDENLEDQRIEEEIHEYTGNLKAKDIVKYLEKFALKSKMYLKKSDDKKASSEEYNKDKIVSSLMKKLKGDEIVPFFDKNASRKLIIYFHNEDEITESLVQLAQKTLGYFQFATVNCKEESSNFICSKIKNKLPQLLLLNEINLPWLNRIQKAVPLKANKYDDMVNEIRYEIPSLVKGVSKETFQPETYKALYNDNKIAAIYLFNKGDVDISFDLISTDDELRESISFFGFIEPTKDQISQFGVPKLPGLVILAGDPNNREK